MPLLISNRFEVHIEGTHSIVIPEGEALPFAARGFTRVQVNAYFDEAEIQFHGALRKYRGVYIISFGKRYQKELGIGISDFFDVMLTEDTTKYGVEMPEELSAVLETDPEAYTAFENLTPGKKRSVIYFIIRIKNVQTRVDKALMLAENLRMGITEQKELFRSH